MVAGCTWVVEDGGTARIFAHPCSCSRPGNTPTRPDHYASTRRRRVGWIDTSTIEQKRRPVGPWTKRGQLRNYTRQDRPYPPLSIPVVVPGWTCLCRRRLALLFIPVVVSVCLGTDALRADWQNNADGLGYGRFPTAKNDRSWRVR